MEENKLLYTRIIKLALLIMCACGLLVFLVTRNVLYLIGVGIGGMLGIGGFLWIVVMTSKILSSPKAQSLAMINYLFRYLIYAVVFCLGMLCGLDIFSMLVGYLCVNLAIKLNTYLEGKEAD